MNLFWFHETLDVLDPTDSYRVPVAAVMILAVTTLIYDRWARTVTEQATPMMQIDGCLSRSDH